MEKDKEWQNKYNKLKEELDQQIDKMQKELDKAQTDKTTIDEVYKGQMNVLSETLAELTSKNAKYKAKLDKLEQK